MTVDTNLLVSSSWELDDIRTVIEKHLGVKVKVRDCSKTSVGMFQFELHSKGKDWRVITVFVNHRTPIGNATLLKMSYNEQAVRILKDIADVLGGFLMEKDCECKYEDIRGMFSGSDGLSYFYQYAALSNELASENDLRGLNQSIHKWHKRVKSASKRDMNLFPEEGR